MVDQEVRKSRIRTLLEGIQTGDPAAVEVIHPETYIQHNPQTHTGREGLAALFKRLAASSPRVRLVRVFADGDYVFAHTEYDFSTRRIGFEVFRFEGEYAVEHWDNIQPRVGPNPSGRSMVDGETAVVDRGRTEANRERAATFVREVLIARQFERMSEWFTNDALIQHNPELEDGRHAWQAYHERQAAGSAVIEYARLHRVLADGNFVLAVSEGQRQGIHSALYDLFRLADGDIVEHWGTVEAVAPKSEWKHDHGKF